ncbi:MAG: DUF4167 domain-containing protein [Sphingomonadaceae bacterium]|nr:DUF4167 domain-containing protein [Sphingomonadaceae bacterium]
MNNRQNGRRRGRNNQRQPSRGGNHDSGNRIDNRARGNATQLLEKYRNMARDAQLSGDRVMTEYYLQFADHYFRVLSDARARQEEQRARWEERDDRDERDDGGDNIDIDGDGGEEADLDPIDMIGRAPRNRDGRSPREPNRDNRAPRSDRTGSDRAGSDRADRRDGNRAPREGDTDEADARGDYRDRGNGRDFERSERRPRGASTHDVRHDADGDALLSIDAAVLPPAIGADNGDGAADNVADIAPAPKRRRTVKKVESSDEAAA